jgi:hypothetical protein
MLDEMKVVLEAIAVIVVVRKSEVSVGARLGLVLRTSNSTLSR